MKNRFLTGIMALILVLAVYAANGDKVNIEQTTLTFSADNDAYNSINELISESANTFYVTNKINGDVTVAVPSVNLTHESDSKNTILLESYTTQPFAMTALQVNKSVELKVNSIKDIEAGWYRGTVKIVNSTNTSQVFDEIAVNVLVPALEVTSIEVRDKESGTTDTKLEKGQTFTVKVNFKNIADYTDLEDVNVQVGIYSSDTDFSDNKLLANIDGDELQSDEDTGDLSSGKTDSQEFEFEMPFDINDKDDFTILAEVTGSAQDTSSTFYAKDTKSISSVVPDSKVEIVKASVVPTTLPCGSNRVRISTELRNIGDSKEQVTLFLRNPSTAFEKALAGGEEIELKDDYTDEEEFTETVDEYVALTDLKEGQNIYNLVAYYNDGDSTVTQELPVTLQACGAQTTTPTTPSTPTTPTTPTTPITPTIPSVPTTTSPVSNPSYVTLKDVSGAGFGSDWVIPAVIGVGGLIIGVIVALLVIPKP